MKTRDSNPLREARKKQLLEDIADAKSALDRAYSNFENVIDPDLIDSSIYELQAVQLKYRFLLKQAELLDLTGR
ncbi:MAG: YaaL family protein [Lachnospiraceae bacterium]|nr:YaaL family protein [Lachnospiraceae bacterium]MCD8362597.1 YaaL family protein [Lachnospiraceae bacterium]